MNQHPQKHLPIESKKIYRILEQYLFLFLGAFVTALALEYFLIPNKIIDGGIVGISIILSYLSGLPLGLIIFFLNLPFLFYGYKQIGKSFLGHSLFAVLSLSIWVTMMQPEVAVIDDLLLASVFGGIILGIGVGLIIRNGGSLDGTEIVAIIINKRAIFSVGQSVMFFNIFILSSAAYVFGWRMALYSILTFFIAFKVIDITIEGLDEAKSAYIISDKPDAIIKDIYSKLGRGITIIEGKGAYTRKKKTILYTVITRLEIAKLKSIIRDIDENAFVTISDVFDVMGGVQSRKNQE